MAERPEPESWRVPQRRPMIAIGAIPLVLLLLLLVAGHFYDTRLRPLRQPVVNTFPAPGIETYIHDGQGDPPREPARRRPDPAIAAAKRALVAEGAGAWR